MVAVYSLSEIDQFTRRIAKHLRGGDILGLSGDLGAGKTTFVKSLGSHWGISPLDITSPTYVYHHMYPTSLGFHLHHIDFYRIESDQSLDALNIFEHIKSEDVACIEWFERFEYCFERYMHLHLRDISSDKRSLTLTQKMWDPKRLDQIYEALGE